MLTNHAVDLSAQLRNGVDGLVAAESLSGDDETRRHWHSMQVQVLQVVGLVADEDLVVHLGRPLPERANEHLRVVGHDVADELLVQRGLHSAQRRQDAADEVVQRLHEEGIGEQVAVELLRLLADEGRRLALIEFPFGVEELRDDDLQRIFVRLEEVLDDDAAHVLGDKLEDVDILAEGEASGGQAIAQHVEFLVETLVSDAVEFEAVAEKFKNPIDLVQRAFRDVFEVDALHHLLHELGGHAFQAEGQAHGLELVLAVGAVHRWDADGDMTLVVDILPAFALFGIEDHGLELVHESVDHCQRLAKIPSLVNLLKFIDFLVGDEGETTERAKDVDRLEAVFLAEIGIQVADVHQAGTLSLVEVVFHLEPSGGTCDKTFIVITRKHKNILWVEARYLAHRLDKVVDGHEPGAFLVNALEDVVGQNGLQAIHFAIAPELEHIEGQADEGVVALGMHLLAEEMHQLILTARNFVHVGGHVADLALGADFVEIDGEDARQLLHLLIIRRDVGVEHLCDFALEEVGVAQENATQFQVDNQGGKQLVHRLLGMFNQLEPHADVLDVVLVHRELPVLADKHVARGDEAKGNEFLLEVVDDFFLLGLVDIDDFQAQGLLEIQHGRHVVLTQFFGQVEDGVDERDEIVLWHLVDGIAHHAVHVPDEAFALILHTR